jgi:hypothetical protein
MTVGVPIAAEEEQGLLAQAQPIGGATAAQGNDAGGAWAGPGGEQRTSGAASPHAFVAPFSPSKQHQPTKVTCSVMASGPREPVRPCAQSLTSARPLASNQPSINQPNHPSTHPPTA